VHWSLTRISRRSSNISRGSRIARSCRLAGAAAVTAGLATVCLPGGDANAQGKLNAHYVATLAGVPIGKGDWLIDIGDDQFSATASGMTTGLLRVFATGDGNSVSRGAVRGDNLTPTLFISTINNDKRVEELKIVMSAGNVKDLVVEPPTTPHPDRVPLTDAHRRGVADPMSATLIRVPGNGDPVAPEACRRTLPIFDGRMRFDLQLSFNRIEKVQIQKGYQGPVVVCGVRFVPVAGHVPERPAIKYLAAQHDIEMWLAPIAGTRVVVPYKISVPTPLGRGVLEATQFVTTATPRGTATAAAR
jgi:hypothetical protein